MRFYFSNVLMNEVSMVPGSVTRVVLNVLVLVTKNRKVFFENKFIFRHSESFFPALRVLQTHTARQTTLSFFSRKDEN